MADEQSNSSDDSTPEQPTEPSTPASESDPAPAPASEGDGAPQDGGGGEGGARASTDNTGAEPQIYRIVHQVWFAVCSSPSHEGGWSDSQRETEPEARADALAHDRENPGHPVSVRSQTYRYSG